MKKTTYDIAIIGAGACGATLAKELTHQGMRTIVLEAGTSPKRLGNFSTAMSWFDRSPLGMPLRSKEGVIIWRVFVDGGGTVVSCANGVRCLEKELSALDISLESEFLEAEQELEIAPIDERLLSSGSRQILTAADVMGLRMELMPKFIRADACKGCGLCVLGCKHGAKWSAIKYLGAAATRGAEIIHNVRAKRILIEDGTVRGVQGITPSGTAEFRANTVIIAAGGLGTPVILQQSGIHSAGKRLFLDLFVTTYGVKKGYSTVAEPPMALVAKELYDEQGFILSPFINHSRLVRLVESGLRGGLPGRKNLVGIMTKIRDDEVGQVFSNGSISKGVTGQDWEKLRQGINLSRQLLEELGVKRNKSFVSKVQGAHPGGTAGIGTVVDSNLQTEVKNLYVCDASVLPSSPGLPPILTLTALAKRLAHHLSR